MNAPHENGNAQTPLGTYENPYKSPHSFFPLLSDLFACWEANPEFQKGWAQRLNLDLQSGLNQWIEDGHPQIEWPVAVQGDSTP
jgi:hypothetical protein